MRVKLLVLSFCLIVFSSYAQEIAISMADTIEPCHPDKIFLIAEIKPVYIGGFVQLSHDLNLRFQPDHNIKGKVYVTCVVNCLGNVSNINIIRGLSPSVDAKVMAELKHLQNWKPAYLSVAIDYRLNLAVDIREGKITISEHN